MQRLFTIDLKDYKENDVHFKRPSARGIIFTEDKKIALVYSERDKYYKFPGGGICEKEDKIEALIREVKEEVGLSVLPNSIKEFGSVLRLQKSTTEEATVFEQESFYYFCQVEDKIGEQRLDNYESEAGFVLRFIHLSEAIRVNSEFKSEDFFEQIMIEREKKVMELILEMRTLFEEGEYSAFREF